MFFNNEDTDSDDSEDADDLSSVISLDGSRASSSDGDSGEGSYFDCEEQSGCDSDSFDEEKDISVSVSCRKCPGKDDIHIEDRRIHAGWHRKLHFLNNPQHRREIGTLKTTRENVWKTWELKEGDNSNTKWKDGYLSSIFYRRRPRRRVGPRPRYDGDLLIKLLYVEGQKYTIGRHFVSREEQGEFIFWFGHDSRYNRWKKINGRGILKSQLRWDYCEISCQRGYFFVKNVNELTGGPYLNGQKIESVCTLQYFDIVSLIESKKRCGNPDLRFEPISSIPVTNKSSGITSSLELKVQQEQDTADAMATSSNSPMLDSYILSHIFSWLPEDSLKRCRLVRRQWNLEAKPWIGKKMVASFNFPRQEVASELGLMQIFLYIQTRRNFSPRHWNISLVPFGKPGRLFHNSWEHGYYSIDNGSKGAKLMADIEWMLNPQFSYKVQKLTLKIHLCTSNDFYIFHKILSHLSPNLESLDLRIKSLNLIDSYIQIDPLTFGSLKGLKLKLKEVYIRRGTDSTLRHRLLKDFIDRLLTGMQQLKHLDLICNDPKKETGVLVVLESLCDRKEQGKGLTRISVPKNTPKVVELLNKLDVQSLKALSFESVLGDTVEQVDEFYKLLLKYGNTLEILDIKIPGSFGEKFTLKLPPSLPKLQRLSIGVQQLETPLRGINDFLVTFGSDSLLLYEKHLPKLNEINVAPNYPKTIDGYDEGNLFGMGQERAYMLFCYILETLFPLETEQIVTSVKRLNIEAIEGKKWEMKKYLNSAQKMFPNLKLSFVD